jgi:hypothetical protein
MIMSMMTQEVTMNSVKRFLNSMRRSIAADASFETYYGMLLREQGSGGPSAREARRDFNAIRGHVDRSMII